MPEVPDEILIPLRDRIQGWTEWDEAAFFLGKLLGMLPEHYSFGNAKELLYGSRPGEVGRQLVLLLNLLSDIGVLEMRNSYSEFRWAAEMITSSSGGAEGNLS